MARTRSSSRRPSRRALGKSNTRQQLIQGALQLLDGDKSLDGLSLRELTREIGVVPTAFYRHFQSMDELGLALVEESFRAFRGILEEVRRETRSTDRLISTATRSLVRHTQEQRLHFRFIASERYGGNAGVRLAVRRELRLIQTELAVDLARFPFLREWSTEDLHMLANLMVNTLVAVAEEILERGLDDRVAEKELIALGEKQLRLIALGIPQWRSS